MNEKKAEPYKWEIPGLDPLEICPDTERYVRILNRKKLAIPSDALVKKTWERLKRDWKVWGITDGQIKRAQRDVDKQWKRDPWCGHRMIWRHVEIRCRQPGGLFFFARDILNLRKLVFHVHDYHLCSYLEESLDKDVRLHFRWHRGSFKSSVVAFAAVIWVMGVDPRQCILLTQAGDKDIKKTLTRIRRAIDTKPQVYATFPGLLPGKYPTTGQNVQWGDDGLITQGKLDESNDAVEGDYSLVGISTLGSATGWHPTLVVGDDLHTVQNTGSPLQIQKVKEFWEDCTGPALQTGSPVWLIDTPWTIDDLGSCIDAGDYGEYHSSIMPIKREIPEGSGNWRYMLRAEDIESYLLSTGEKQDKKDVGRGSRGFDDTLAELQREKISYFRWMAQYMCQPIPPGEVHFSEKGWKTWTDVPEKAPWKQKALEYDHEGRAMAEWYDKMELYAFWDPAVAESRQSDYTACGVVGLSTWGTIYVLDYVYDKIPPRLGIEMIHQLFLPPTPGFSRFWRDRPRWPTPENEADKERLRCWNPNFVVTDKSVVEQSFMGGIQERQDKTGFAYRIHSTFTMKGKGKQDWILKSLDRYFNDGLIRVKSPHLKMTHNSGGRVEDISRKVKMEYDWFLRQGTHDDFLDGLAKVSYYFTSAFRPRTPESVVPRSEAERMLEGWIRGAHPDEVIPGYVEEGSPVIDLSRDPEEDYLQGMLDQNEAYADSLEEAS